MPVTQRIPLLSAIALACAVSLPAQANPNSPDYSKVVLYGNVTIAQDSTSSWGVWEEIEPPAAGTPVPLTAIRGGSELYRPLGQPTLPDTPQQPAGGCASGALCGFGVLSDGAIFERSRAAFDGEGSGSVSVGFTLTPQIVSAQEGAVPAPAWLPGAMLISLTPLNGDVPAINGFGPLQYVGSDTHAFGRETETGYEVGEMQTMLGQTQDVYGVEASADPFYGNISRYVNGSEETLTEGSGTSLSMHGVWGVTTTAQDMDTLRQGQVIANYTGEAMSGKGSTVKARVDFGASTFTMSVNGGRDNGGVFVSPDGKQVMGRVGFDAAGVISGSNIRATSLSAKDGTVSGQFVGAFVGANAAGMIGVADIVKTRPISSDPLPTYTNARHVTPIIAVRDDLRPQQQLAR